jgi:4-amino-4-deoxy-L-arabinose transferase-like glycosyltransferase
LRRRSDAGIAAGVAAAAALLLFANLGAVYLWQDEAATAVLGRRLLEHGKPLAYDGRNLITMDHFLPEAPDAVRQRAAEPAAAIAHAVRRHEFRADTTWTGQPWGQFLVAGLSIAAFGSTTLAARAPFALAGVLAVLLFLRLVRREGGRRDLALAALVLLLSNAYWILHLRQCRYYALSSLALVASVAAFLRWRDGRRFGAALFVATAWAYFQVDYGSFWPSLAALFAYAALSERRAWPRLRPILATGLVLLAAVLPWVLYYELPERFQESTLDFARRLTGHARLFDRYVLALPVALLAAAAFAALRARLAPGLRRLLALSLGIVSLDLLWITLTTPHPFLRYQIQLVPLACLLAAWIAWDVLGGGPAAPLARRAAGAATLALLALTPWASAPFGWLAPPAAGPERAGVLRAELGILARELFTRRPDPNRDVIEWVRAHTAPGDEILVTYEDVPFLFYTELRVRGGIAAFRVLDETAEPPRIAVLRAAPFLHREPFREALARQRWRFERVPTPDAVWGNNPDPAGQYWNLPRDPAGVRVAERVGP